MTEVNKNEIIHLKILNQYIKDLSYENFQKSNVNENDTSVDIKVINKPHDNDHFGVIIKIIINCKSKKEKINIFHLELDYFGFFKLESIKNFDVNKLSSEGAKLLFPFARFIIANITQNGGNVPIILDNVDFNLMKS
jgi:preprotein translocase subunit SecB